MSNTSRLGEVMNLCDRFCNGFLDQHNGPIRQVAEEIEHPIVDGAGLAANWQAEFEQMSASEAVTKVGDFRLRLDSGDEIMPEAGWSTIELATKPYFDLYQLDCSARRVMVDMADLLAREGKLIMGYGIQPISHENDVPWVDHPRYRILQKSLGADNIRQMTIVASQQVQVDVTAGEAVRAINVLCELSGLLTAMLCHSSVWYGRPGPEKAIRELAWQGIDHRRVGIPPRRFRTLKDYFTYVIDLPMVYIQAGGEYQVDQRPLRRYLLNGASEDEFDTLFRAQEKTVWPIARLRWRDEGCSTVEYRGACTQKPGDRSVSALILGLMENLSEAEELAERLSWFEWKQVRREAIRSGLGLSVPPRLGSVRQAGGELVRIAEAGLRSRGLNEEDWLDEVKRRLKELRTPADEAVVDWQAGGCWGLIEKRII